MIHGLSREPRPGVDRVVIRAADGAPPVYLAGARAGIDPAHNRIGAEPRTVTWSAYYGHLASEGAIEVLGFEGDPQLSTVESSPPAAPAEQPVAEQPALEQPAAPAEQPAPETNATEGT